MPKPFSRWLAVSFVLAAVAAAVVTSALLYIALPMVRSGRGLEPYPTSVDDFTWLGFMVLIGAIPVALLIALVFWFFEHLEWHSLERRYGRRGGSKKP